MTDKSQQVDLSAFETAKKASVLQLLFKCARLANEQAITRLQQKPSRYQIRQAHTTLFPHIDFTGSRLTSIANKLGITKQAVSQLVDELEAFGMVERIPDPSDGRAKLVRFTEHGRQRMTQGLDTLQEVAKELEAQIGSAAMADLHQILLKLEGVLEAQGEV